MIARLIPELPPLPISALNGERVGVRGSRLFERVAAPHVMSKTCFQHDPLPVRTGRGEIHSLLLPLPHPPRRLGLRALRIRPV